MGRKVRISYFMGSFPKNTEYVPSFLNKTAMDDTEERLRQLVAETCRNSSGSTERQQGLTQIVRLIVKSGKLWKDNAPYYDDALQQTWLYFCRNLCEATTGEKYDPNWSSVITWLNAYLKRRLQDGHIQEQTALAQTASVRVLEANEVVDSTEQVEAPPDIPPILETTRQWLENDPEGELRRIHINKHPEVTCQVLLLRRLPPKTSWETLSAEFGLSISTLSSFYRRQCIPRLRQFGESQGYL